MVTINNSEPTAFGLLTRMNKVLNVSNDKLNNFSAKAYADVIAQAAKRKGTQIVLVSSSTDSLYLAPLVAVALETGYASNEVFYLKALRLSSKRTAFSNKAFNITEISTPVKVLGIAKNSLSV